MSIRFWRSGFSTMNVTACSAPTSCGTSWVPPQPGMRPEEDLGAGEVAHRGRDRAVVAVQGDLDAAADGGSVDRRDRHEREVADAAEELVPRLTAEACSLRGDLAELADVGADGEDERLPGQQHPSPVARPELVEHALERPQCGLPERVRLLPVLAVVHRHERDRADARVDALQLELGWLS